MRISLTSKILFLVSLILVSEVFFVWTINDLESQAECLAVRAQRSQRVSDLINSLTRKMYEFYSIFENADVKNYDYYSTTYKSKSDLFKNEIKELLTLVKNNPEQYKIIKRSSDSMISMMATLKELSLNTDDESTWSNEIQTRRKKLWKKVQSELAVAMDDEILSVNRAEKAIANKSPEQMAAYRQELKALLFWGLAGNIMLSIMLALFLVRTITDRLNLMSANVLKFASNQPLNEPLKGDDEIAKLDKAFHSMADALELSNHKQRSVLDNAKDMIFSIDSQGKFSELNPASMDVLGYESDDLIGSYFIDVVQADDAATILDTMEKLKAGDIIEPFEIRLTHKDGHELTTAWSIHWSTAEKSFFCVVHDISEIVEIQQLKNELTAMISHDLRTPLASVMVYLEMLETGMFGDLSDDGVKLNLAAASNAQKMLSLINDLLDIEKINAGMMDITKVEVDLGILLANASELSAPRAMERKIKIDAENSNLNVSADEAKISRVLDNLLVNAIKFSPDDTTIKLTSKEIDGQVIVSVSDSGEGIEEDQIKNVFERFSQVHSKDSQTGGSGLGLAICKAFVELHDGRIWVESEKGSGTTFSFSLPLT